MQFRGMPLARLTAGAATALLAVLAASACSDHDTTGPGATGTRIEISSDTVFLDRGASQRLTPKLLNASGQEVTGGSFTYSVSDTSVAGADAQGTITARRGGVATVRVVSGKIEATVPVLVLGHPDASTIENFAGLGLAGRPHGVAIARSGTFYVSQIGAASATRGTLTAVAQSFGSAVTVGSAPAHVAINPQGTKAYTTNQYGNSVSVIDVASNAVTATIPLSSGGFNLLVSPNGDRVYATTEAGSLYVIDAATNQVLKTLVVGASANGLAYHAPSKTLYVSSRDASTVTAINAETNTVTRTYTVSGMPQRIAVSRDGTELYIATELAGLEILTLASGARVTVPGVDAGAVGLALSPDQAEIYVTNPPLGRLYIVGRASRTLLRGLHIEGGVPRNVAFDYFGRVALITDEAGGVIFAR